jgi:histidine triad (HIT) family protein
MAATTFNHAPRGYNCPLCRNVAAEQGDHPLEILHRYERVFVKVNPKWWPRNAGSALVIPNDHYENVLDLPVALGSSLQEAVRDTALAMKTAFGCSGISTRQHNEPDGNQDVWHYHVHVFPRYADDGLYRSEGVLAPADDIRRVAEALRAAWPSA